jgi:dipeptidyl-peptidase-4
LIRLTPNTRRASSVIHSWGLRTRRCGLAIVSVAAPKGAPVSVRWDARRHPYLMSVAWPKHAPPTIEVRDRRFQHSAVLAIDPDTGATQTLLSEEDAAWLNMDASVPRWLPDGSAFLWSTERNG